MSRGADKGSGVKLAATGGPFSVGRCLNRSNRRRFEQVVTDFVNEFTAPTWQADPMKALMVLLFGDDDVDDPIVAVA